MILRFSRRPRTGARRAWQCGQRSMNSAQSVIRTTCTPRGGARRPCTPVCRRRHCRRLPTGWGAHRHVSEAARGDPGARLLSYSVRIPYGGSARCSFSREARGAPFSRTHRRGLGSPPARVRVADHVSEPQLTRGGEKRSGPSAQGCERSSRPQARPRR